MLTDKQDEVSMAKRTTRTAGDKAATDAPKRPAAKKAALKKPAAKRAAPRRKADEEDAPRKAARRPRGPSLSAKLRDTAGKLLARADDEALKNILTAGALAAAAVMLGEAAADAVDDADTPAGKAKLKAAAAAGGAAMGAQLLRTLEETRERKGLATSDGFDPKVLAAKAVSALIK